MPKVMEVGRGGSSVIGFLQLEVARSPHNCYYWSRAPEIEHRWGRRPKLDFGGNIQLCPKNLLGAPRQAECAANLARGPAPPRWRPPAVPTPIGRGYSHVRHATTPVHHAPRRCRRGLAARRARAAAGDAGGRISRQFRARTPGRRGRRVSRGLARNRLYRGPKRRYRIPLGRESL
jgi:hypothetical protein